MFDFMKGQIVSLSEHKAVLQVGSIGYLLACPLSTLCRLAPGMEVMLYTHLVIREDSHTLYGFFSQEERSIFEMACSVSGIGPKTALNLISHMEKDRLQEAICTENISLLSKIPGIGKKTAERLVVELKDKLYKMARSSSDDQPDMEVYKALLNLGFQPNQIDPCLRELRREEPAIHSTEELLRKLLQRLHARQIKK